MKKKSIFTKFYYYQKSRFPILIIGLSLIPAILSSGAIVSGTISTFQVVAALVISLLYILHIRILDDRRDFKHDSLYHKERPVQKGIITNHDLLKIDIVVLPTLILLTAFFGVFALLLIFIMLIYSFLAERSFFIEMSLKKNFFIYNLVNTIQTFILQLLVYTIFAGTIPFTTLLITHYAFTCIGTIIFEFVRKVKLPKEDGSGRDTYTWYLGFQKAILVYITLAFINLFLFLRIMQIVNNHGVFWLLFSVSGFIIIALISYLHLRKRDHLTEILLQMSFIVIYALCNLVIYFSRIY